MAEGAPREARPAATYRVALLADVRLYRDGLAATLHGRPELEMLGAAPVNEAGLEFLAAAQPDIVLLDAVAARTSATVHAIRAVAADAKVVAFAVGDEERDAILCVEAGVSGYVSSEASLDDLVGTIVRVAQGEFPCSPRVAASPSDSMPTSRSWRSSTGRRRIWARTAHLVARRAARAAGGGRTADGA